MSVCDCGGPRNLASHQGCCDSLLCQWNALDHSFKLQHDLLRQILIFVTTNTRSFVFYHLCTWNKYITKLIKVAESPIIYLVIFLRCLIHIKIFKASSAASEWEKQHLCNFFFFFFEHSRLQDAQRGNVSFSSYVRFISVICDNGETKINFVLQCATRIQSGVF